MILLQQTLHRGYMRIFFLLITFLITGLQLKAGGEILADTLLQQIEDMRTSWHNSGEYQAINYAFFKRYHESDSKKHIDHALDQFTKEGIMSLQEMCDIMHLAKKMKKLREDIATARFPRTKLYSMESKILSGAVLATGIAAVQYKYGWPFNAFQIALAKTGAENIIISNSMSNIGHVVVDAVMPRYAEGLVEHVGNIAKKFLSENLFSILSNATRVFTSTCIVPEKRQTVGAIAGLCFIVGGNLTHGVSPYLNFGQKILSKARLKKDKKTVENVQEYFDKKIENSFGDNPIQLVTYSPEKLNIIGSLEKKPMLEFALQSKVGDEPTKDIDDWIAFAQSVKKISGYKPSEIYLVKNIC